MQIKTRFYPFDQSPRQLLTDRLQHVISRFFPRDSFWRVVYSENSFWREFYAENSSTDFHLPRNFSTENTYLDIRYTEKLLLVNPFLIIVNLVIFTGVSSPLEFSFPGICTYSRLRADVHAYRSNLRYIWQIFLHVSCFPMETLDCCHKNCFIRWVNYPIIDIITAY